MAATASRRVRLTSPVADPPWRAFRRAQWRRWVGVVAGAHGHPAGVGEEDRGLDRGGAARLSGEAGQGLLAAGAHGGNPHVRFDEGRGLLVEHQETAATLLEGCCRKRSSQLSAFIRVHPWFQMQFAFFCALAPWPAAPQPGPAEGAPNRRGSRRRPRHRRAAGRPRPRPRRGSARAVRTR